MAQVPNLSPFSVEVPAALEVAFTQAGDDLLVAQGSTQALLDTFTAFGGTLAYMSRPNASSGPEHRHVYAVWTRLCVGKAAMMLGVEPAEFEPVYSGAVKASDTVEIGRREARRPNGDLDGIRLAKSRRSLIGKVTFPMLGAWSSKRCNVSCLTS
jgi:hypothetical protein